MGGGRNNNNNNRRGGGGGNQGGRSVDKRGGNREAGPDEWEQAPVVAKARGGTKIGALLGKSGSTASKKIGLLSKNSSFGKDRGSRPSTPTNTGGSRFDRLMMMDQDAGAHQAPYVTKQDSKNKDLAFIKNMLQKEPEMSDDHAKKLAGSVLEDILNGRVPFKEGADQWWGKSLRVKGNPKEGTKDEYRVFLQRWLKIAENG